MERQAPAGLLRIHVDMPATVPADIASAVLSCTGIPSVKALSNGDPAPPGLSAAEKAAYEQLNDLYTRARAIPA